MITVFTPTYNRAYIINNLYKSLCQQTDKDFEWIIVDDGSVDNTESVISEFIKQKIINIQYFKQRNGGKHRAINFALKKAKGELFFIVDSDDQIYDNAIEIINTEYQQIKNNNNFAGLSGIKTYFDGKYVGSECNFDFIDCNAIDFRYKYNINGDMAEVFKTDILKQYPFPEIENEKFCPEALVWNRISQKYKLRYLNRKIYKCDYLSDGLTAKITRIRMDSPIASMIHYSELSKYNVPLKIKIRSYINFWRFAPCSNLNFDQKSKMISCLSYLFMPIGYLMHVKDKKR